MKMGDVKKIDALHVKIWQLNKHATHGCFKTKCFNHKRLRRYIDYQSILLKIIKSTLFKCYGHVMIVLLLHRSYKFIIWFVNI